MASREGASLGDGLCVHSAPYFFSSSIPWPGTRMLPSQTLYTGSKPGEGWGLRVSLRLATLHQPGTHRGVVLQPERQTSVFFKPLSLYGCLFCLNPKVMGIFKYVVPSLLLIVMTLVFFLLCKSHIFSYAQDLPTQLHFPPGLSPGQPHPISPQPPFTSPPTSLQIRLPYFTKATNFSLTAASIGVRTFSPLKKKKKLK